MTTTPTTTCPAWCTRDHDAANKWAREIHALVEYATPEQALAELDDDDLAYQRDYHSTDDLAADFYLRITTEVTEAPTISFGAPDDLTAEQARACGQALLAAADKLDEIEAAL